MSGVRNLFVRCLRYASPFEGGKGDDFQNPLPSYGFLCFSVAQPSPKRDNETVHPTQNNKTSMVVQRVSRCFGEGSPGDGTQNAKTPLRKEGGVSGQERRDVGYTCPSVQAGMLSREILWCGHIFETSFYELKSSNPIAIGRGS